jgi:Zn-finger nucleic acid-binding protein
MERLRRKYLKSIPCPQCGKNLGAVVAIGLGGMACPDYHGAWGDQDTLKQLVARLRNAAALRHEAQEGDVSIPVGRLAAELSRKHPAEIDCPDCGSRLEAEAAISAGAVGLTGMACPKQHGAWIDQDMLAEIRKRLDAVTSARHS